MPYKILQYSDQKYCLQCGSRILYGRPDKKFCCVKCKDLFHNNEQKVVREMRNKLTTILSRNYQILSVLLKAGRTTIHVADIQAMGYNINCVSWCYCESSRTSDFACYDILYSKSGLKIYNIRRAPNPPGRPVVKSDKTKAPDEPVPDVQILK
ncbi:MAG: hypothetical protein IJ795_01780 [Bacteroidales bacterium]|nr:hypothetical protein [Bacteroidales bacterium]